MKNLLRVIKYIMLGLCIMLIVGFLAIIIFGPKQGELHLTVDNRSDYRIVRGEIQLDGKSAKLFELPSGSQAQFDMDVTRDGSVQVMIDFDGGQKLQEDIGYVTPGFSVSGVLIVENQGLMLTNRNVVAVE